MPKVQNLMKIILSDLHQRFGDVEDNILIAQATILDPKFKVWFY